ncbi:ABC transporter ATP-binding protein [Gordonia polyisoprenivorans]|uniref:ABC transporter ATP-binding protein n=1 Tax=Gordonia polyisoprenivorans TaxID=84595 RepID=UPI001AD7ACB4|nr:ABC transporter ATP-binding protein [Gordonia polyisoprenivorans]QTI71001.1 ABC transporter ATP-binding protein [Gordonia polyisoprenivorans]
MTESQLSFDNVTAGYGASTVLRDIDLEVRSGQVVALLGANGAGKTTLLRTAAGLIRPTGGRVLIGDEVVNKAAPHFRSRAGLCLIPEGRGVFKGMTVRDNLLMQIPPWEKDKSFEVALAAFPALETRLGELAGRLSGGQQQMVALSRAYLAKPDVVLLDEVSMGLAPVIVDQIFESLRALAAQGTALLVVEQYVERALEMSDHVYMLNHGGIVFSGSSSELDEEAVMRGYLGHAVEEAAEGTVGERQPLGG